ncbi:alanine--tRNA ligase [Prochlorococcus sp. MIT 1300]|uniref:alanine--tRNA ligase n=1 Tax=Prochlorococcus sp. MIT 1300 TaxID=3096218 RepID=UPI002A7475BC|nr:alanine--tRNA ligase [Prochlorococcus sp. MIT 1300]
MPVAKKSGSRESRPRTGDEIRSAFLQFFAQRDHKLIPSASLVPEDPTVLLTIAGMLPFKPVFLGQSEPPSPRATSSQKCIRTNDIDNVGRTARHHTFFEMLGNFSFGDYFKEQAIRWAWELSVDVFGLDPKNLVVSVFREDEEAETIWRDLIGVDPKRIIRMGEADNFWAAGPTGPCGPCSEMYYDFRPELGNALIDLEDDTRFIEFYNLVFMEHNRDGDGRLTPLENRNIDTGMGLERMAQILQNVPNNYETDLIFPLLEKAADLAEVDYYKLNEQSKTSLKVIGDHSRAIVQLIGDGVIASNLGRGYVLRRLIRRVVRHGRLMGIHEPFLEKMGKVAIDLMKKVHPQLQDRREVIIKELKLEESRFLATLARGESLIKDLLIQNPEQITGQQAFELYDTYGFPLELTQEIASEHGLKVDVDAFDEEMNAQKERAKAAAVSIDLTVQDVINQITLELDETNFSGYQSLKQSSQVLALIVDGKSGNMAKAGDSVQVLLDATCFYGEGGGQVGDCGYLINKDLKVSVNTVTRSQGVFIHCGQIESGTLEVGDLVQGVVDHVFRRMAQAHHTATHLLQSALRKVVDANISQAGSLVDFDHLRFDFHFSRSVTLQELDQIENLINSWIVDAHALVVKDMDIDIAKASGALAMFGEKYADVVRVVDVPGVSMELCGGTHVKNTSEIGLFKIVSESGIAAGIRRIEAVAGHAVLDYLNERDLVVKNLGKVFKAKPLEIVDRVLSLQNDLKATSKVLAATREELAKAKALAMLNQALVVGQNQLLVTRLDGAQGDALQLAAQGLVEQLGASGVVVLGGLPDPGDTQKVILVAAFGDNVVASGLQAGKFIGRIAKICGGGGGGRANLAQAGGRDGAALDRALGTAEKELAVLLQ